MAVTRTQIPTRVSRTRGLSLSGLQTRSLLSSLGLVVLSTIILIPAWLSLELDPYPDSGVFLYTAWRMLQGDLPYRDVWDHKPPAIFAIVVLGLVVGRGAPLGVWLVQWFAVVAAALVGFFAFRRSFGTCPALVGSCSWLLGLPIVLQRGNLAEEYALPLQLAALLLITVKEHARFTSAKWLAIGCLGGLTFSLRQNLIGIWAATVVMLLYQANTQGDWRGAFSKTALMFVGAAVVVASWLLYFAFHGALPEVWDAVFVFNAQYSAVMPLRARVEAPMVGVSLLADAGIWATGLLGWIVSWAVRSDSAAQDDRRPLMVVLTAGLPIELALSSISGHNYPHYFIPWLPMLGLGSAALGSELLRTRPVFSLIFAVWLGVSAISPLIFTAREALSQRPKSTFAEIAAHIKALTTPEDHVLVLGGSPALNFQARRAAGVRHVYFPPGGRPEMVTETFSEIAATQPALLIVPPDAPPLERDERDRWLERQQRVLPSEMSLGLDMLNGRYTLQAVVTPSGWRMYRPLSIPGR